LLFLRDMLSYQFGWVRRMKIEVSFTIRGDAGRVERSIKRAYIAKELRRKNTGLFSEIIHWKGEVFPVAISWKEHQTSKGHGASFWVAVEVKEDRDLTSAFKMALRIKKAIEKGLGKEAQKHKDVIYALLKGYNGGRKK